MNKLPNARTENLVEQNLEKETLIYDLVIDKAFNLNETSTIVYKACNGKTSFDDLKRKHKFSDEFIYLALDELKRNNLLADTYESPFSGTSRREVIRKVGLASMFVLPIVAGLVAPRAANAASGRPGSGDESALLNLYDACCIGNGCSQCGFGPYEGSALQCNSGHCCYRFTNGNSLQPGETYSDVQGTIFIPPVNGKCDVSDYSCASLCCDGRDGTVVSCAQYDPLIDDETGETNVCIARDCTCVCP